MISVDIFIKQERITVGEQRNKVTNVQQTIIAVFLKNSVFFGHQLQQ